MAHRENPHQIVEFRPLVEGQVASLADRDHQFADLPLPHHPADAGMLLEDQYRRADRLELLQCPPMVEFPVER